MLVVAYLGMSKRNSLQQGNMYSLKLLSALLVIAVIALVRLSTARECEGSGSLDVRPACPRSPRKMDETVCESLDLRCCWNNSISAYPKCYYKPVNQKYNAALGRQTYMSSQPKHITTEESQSSNGVDGCTQLDISQKCCFHTGAPPDTWWSVDLGSTYLVVSVTIQTANVGVFYIRDFTIKLSRTSFDPHSVNNMADGGVSVCAQHPSVVPIATTERIPCTKTISARYVIIHKITPANVRPLLLCEVKVETAGRFNAAFGKIASMSSIYAPTKGNCAGVDFGPWNAVDGCFGESYTTSCCAHTPTQQTTETQWIAVDLGQVYTIYSATIVNGRDGTQTLIQDKYEILLSNSSYVIKPFQSVSCVDKPLPSIPLRSAKHFQCTEPKAARHVTVKKKPEKYNYALHFCEIEVEAACRYDRHGPNCWYECHCQNQVACDPVTGVCPHGLCDAGYQGVQCNISRRCPPAKYGEDCSETCSPFCKNKDCDAISGLCLNGCESGYTPPYCTETLTFNYAVPITVCLCVVMVILLAVITYLAVKLRHSSKVAPNNHQPHHVYYNSRQQESDVSVTSQATQPQVQNTPEHSYEPLDPRGLLANI